jgi:hypothetical protein
VGADLVKNVSPIIPSAPRKQIPKIFLGDALIVIVRHVSI